MKVTKETIEKIAHLSRLNFDENSAEEMQKDLNKIIDWVDKLSELDTDNVDPLIYVNENKNVMRKDEKGEHLNHDTALKNAPKKDSNYIRVPKVIE